MDLYKTLRLSPDASKEEIEKAYQRLLKEARYDAHINKKDVEVAYRILMSSTQRVIYDSKLKDIDRVKTQKTVKLKSAREGRKIGFLKRLTVRELSIIAIVLLVIAIFYYSVRFGYQLKSFEVGDVLYMKETNQRLGRIVQVERNHNFGKIREDAYLVDTPTEQRWLPTHMAKAYCFK